MKKSIIISTIILLVSLPVAIISGCAMPTPAPKLEIPAHFSTYTDEANLFSISYPPDWELALSEMEATEQATRELLESIEADLPTEKTRLIFLCEHWCEGKIDAGVNIIVGPLPKGMRTLEKVVDGDLQQLKDLAPDYRLFSQLKTTINGREAVIVDEEATIPNQPKFRSLFLFVLVDKNIWCMTCSTSPEKFGDWENDFHAIVRSLRIHK